MSLAVGDRVTHDRFGLGTVVAVGGPADDAKATIDFGAEGTKQLLLRRLRGEWPRPDHGPHFSLGRWGLPVNIFAVLYGAAMTVNLAWPRASVYGSDHWYFQWGAVVFLVVIVAVGTAMLLLRKRKWTASQAVLSEQGAS